jgi:hypothetical protein
LTPVDPNFRSFRSFASLSFDRHKSIATTPKHQNGGAKTAICRSTTLVTKFSCISHHGHLPAAQQHSWWLVFVSVFLVSKQAFLGDCFQWCCSTVPFSHQPHNWLFALFLACSAQMPLPFLDADGFEALGQGLAS